MALRPLFQCVAEAGLACRPQPRTSVISLPSRLCSSNGGLISAPQRPRDHHLLNLVGALADREDLGVAVEAAHGVLLDVAVAAVDLHGLLAGADGQAAGLELGLGRRQREALAGVLFRSGLVRE